MSQKKQIVERCKGNLSSASLCGQNGIFEEKKTQNLSGETNARNEASRTDR